MRNLTVRVPDDVYLAARSFAALHQTSITNTVTDFLCTLRGLARSAEPISPAAAIDLHCEKLRESPSGRVNPDPFNEKEWNAVTRYLLEVLANSSSTATVHSRTNPE